MYEINFDSVAQVLRLKIGGFWDAATTQAFVRDLTTAAQSAHANGPYCVLSDARAFSVQNAETVERFRQLAEAGSARRTAIIVESSLARLQARRSMANERVRIFGDEAEAKAWLGGEGR